MGMMSGGASHPTSTSPTSPAGTRRVSLPVIPLNLVFMRHSPCMHDRRANSMMDDDSDGGRPAIDPSRPPERWRTLADGAAPRRVGPE